MQVSYVPDILPKAKSKNFIAWDPFNKTTKAILFDIVLRGLNIFQYG